MGDEEGHTGTSGSSATVAQPSTSQSPIFHQISPPQPLALRPSGEIADTTGSFGRKSTTTILLFLG